MKTEIINLTPHAINIVDDEKNIIKVIEPAEFPARVTVSTVRTEDIICGDDTIPTSKSVYGVVEGLPEKEEGVIYVVSSLVAQRVPERDDVFIPNESVRDNYGRIIGCKSLGRI